MQRRPKANRYDWDDKREICYKLYVEEGKSLRQIVKYFSEFFNVPESELPSYRLFARQFSQKWGFESPRMAKKLSAETEDEIVARMLQLWQQNVSVKDTKEILDDEGYELSNYDFRRLRLQHGMNHRAAAKYQDPSQVGPKSSKGKKRAIDEVDPSIAEAENPGTGDGVQEYAQPVEDPSQPLPDLSPEETARRAERLAQIQAESDQRLSARKRRRRIRGFGHLPPDALGTAPRYASETSLDECKAFLQLDNDTYIELRKQYEGICREMDIERKKTSLEDGRWQASKDRLVHENAHLLAVMNPLLEGIEQKNIGLDNICADVTKRMRSMKRQITIPDANNILGLNPASSKGARRAFYEILEADHYTTRLACGDEHWEELRQKWFTIVPLLGVANAERDAQKNKAIDLLARDACKRYCDNQLKNNPDRKLYHRSQYGPGPGAAKHRGPTLPKRGVPLSNDAPTAAQALAALQQGNVASFDNNLELTSSIAAGDSATGNHNNFIDPALQDLLPPPTVVQAPAALPLSIPAYFRLSPASQIVGNHPRMWLGRLTSVSLSSLHAAAISKAGAATVVRVQGIIKRAQALDADGNPIQDGQEGAAGGEEDMYQIDGDEELAVYLEAAGEKPTFLVQLEGGYA
ncbi:Hypothetical protein R9X50_00344000 [Acrodontium crateriforme]|uniref:Clr5 domain-containing protein n=1 Tax=Acrodontium crateriforme TaxID=150365 RepID=A0AAQ3M3C8_9PEZI|nr:Hypothetical protein R9X50_00344000 [Acrodontium crateriforme]